jgi:hypothetical protein
MKQVFELCFKKDGGDVRTSLTPEMADSDQMVAASRTRSKMHETIRIAKGPYDAKKCKRNLGVQGGGEGGEERDAVSRDVEMLVTPL